jgi:uncharacterized protein YbjT (DUF2867 family)
MSTRIAVAGGTGVVGRHVVDVLRERGHEPVVLSRAGGVDVTTGAGLDGALDGVSAVVDVTNRETLRRREAREFFGAATTHLLDAGRRAGVARHVALSIVGIDDVDTGYYAAKLHQEQLVLADPRGIVLRATQFHEFAGQMMERSSVGPLRLVPRMRVQPVAAREVGEVLAELAVDGAPGRAADLAGPEEHEMVDLARRVLAARGERGVVVPLPVPGAAGRAMARGALTGGPGARLGRTRFDEWLSAVPRR